MDASPEAPAFISTLAGAARTTSLGGAFVVVSPEVELFDAAGVLDEVDPVFVEVSV